MPQESVYIETFGCQMNTADTERAATRLRAAGYKLTARAEEADVVLFNTCSIRARAEQKVFNRIGELRHEGREPLIGVMGCVAQLEGEALFDVAPEVRVVVGTRATDRLPALLARARAGERQVLDLAERQADERWDVSLVERHSPHVGFVPIIEGCNKFCTYCIVPYSRGREWSRPATEIVAEIRRLRELGYQEVQLIGQNVNSYRPKTNAGLDGYEGATPFARLLRAVAATGMPRIKYTTSFPRDFHPDIVRAMDEHENLCDWIHLPVQSGSDRILSLMRRGYKVADYLKRVEVIRQARRRYALTSDIIVGFPSETSEDFEQTLRLVEQCQFDSLYIFKYSPRAGTPAALLADAVSDNEMSMRFSNIKALQQGIQARVFASYLGRDLKVLVEGESARAATDLTGHSTCNKVVNFPGSAALIGQAVQVWIKEAKAHSLYGELRN
ncbi:MAG: tRNA (N6-isopentenyl adenosine(37)-C2)-methylthiotransferase MiaB [Pyrinomonadaceae bacterium]